MTVNALTMSRIAGTDSLGGYIYTVDVNGATVSLSYEAYQTLDKLIGDAIAAQQVYTSSPALSIEKQVLATVFAGLDGNKPEDLAKALERFRGIMSGG